MTATLAAGSDVANDDPDMGTPPFVPPGIEPHNGKLAHEDTSTDLPAWLENLTPSAPASESHDTQFPPYGSPPDFGAAPGNGMLLVRVARPTQYAFWRPRSDGRRVRCPR